MQNPGEATIPQDCLAATEIPEPGNVKKTFL